MLRRRFLLALALSLLLHALGIWTAWLEWFAAPLEPPPSPALRAELRPAETSRPAPLLKNTLDATNDVETRLAMRAPDRPKEGSGWRRRAPDAQIRAAQRKLSEHLFYPEQARVRGIEGEVRLLLRLDESGVVLDAQVASSSGFAVLDEAAVGAALATHRLAAGGAREMILPVIFRLQ